MHVGAAVSAVCLIVALGIAAGDIAAAARGRRLGYSLTAARLSQLEPLILTLLLAGGLAVIALWLLLARTNGRGRNWARVLSTALFGLATAQLTGGFGRQGSRVVPGVAEFGLLGAVLAWLPGLAAVWLLWRPDATAFFKP